MWNEFPDTKDRPKGKNSSRTKELIYILVIVGIMATPACAVSGAAFTTDNPGFEEDDGYINQACLNGPVHDKPAVNCNIYGDKRDVWINGGPSSGKNRLTDGEYFFAVIEPGGQPDPNDGSEKLLSTDSYGARTFTVYNGKISAYAGPHISDSTHTSLGLLIQLVPYEDTTNPGGVYILAMCSLERGYPVNPRDCKYDAFKVRFHEDIPPPVELAVVKGADPEFNRIYEWEIEKSVDKTDVKQNGGTATFNYVTSVWQTGFTDGAWKVSGIITVLNPNDATVTVDVTDAVDDQNANCEVTDGTDVDIEGETAQNFDYICTYSEKPSDDGVNTATVTWEEQTLSNGKVLEEGSASFAVPFSFGDPTTTVDKTITVTDTFEDDGPMELGTLTAEDAEPFASDEFAYSVEVSVPRFNCVTYTNIAEIVETEQWDDQTVRVCGPVETGARTMGFWQNKNGQNIIKDYWSGTSGTNLRDYLRLYKPFQDLNAGATNTQTATYIYNIIKAADARGSSMNAMLKAQMLATALDVYFSDPALGGNRIGAPGPIGDVEIDLTKICTDMTCTTYRDVSAAFGGDENMTVSQILAYVAGQSNAGGSTWYGNVKATQELAKDTFDAINNQKVFSP